MPCPRCATSLVGAGERWSCRRCDGEWIGTATLMTLVLDAAPDLHPHVGLPFATCRVRTGRRCPHDDDVLETAWFGGVVIDHCEHGAWFDARTLDEAMQRLRAWYETRDSWRDLPRGFNFPMVRFGPRWLPDPRGIESFGEGLRRLGIWISGGRRR